MNKFLLHSLKNRKEPVRVAIVGCGWYGSGVVKELSRLPNIIPKVLIDISIEKAAACLGPGIPKERISVLDPQKGAIDVRDSDKYLVSSDIGIIKKLKGIDLVFEAIGDVLSGTQAALYSIEAGINFVTVNAEMDATVGLRLAGLAREKGVIYTNSDGDQPGCLARLVEDITLWGFTPKVIGNCKGFLDKHQTPRKVMPFVPKGQDPAKICSFADGSKQSLELAVVANAFGCSLFKRGMLGPEVPKRGLIIKTFDELVGLKSVKGAYVDYVMHVQGPGEGIGVFIIAERFDERIGPDLEYFKMGKGPFYLFFREYHLCYLETLSTILEVALFKKASIVPVGRFADVIAIAKRDLEAGQKLEGIGEHDFYGEIEKADIVANERLLPLGIAKDATVIKRVSMDTPLTYDMVELPDNPAVRARGELEKTELLTSR